MADPVTEQRLATLERKVSHLKERASTLAAPANWIGRIAGSMADFPEFEDVVRFGREIGESDRPKED
jgi:hypothetical protein